MSFYDEHQAEGRFMAWLGIIMAVLLATCMLIQ